MWVISRQPPLASVRDRPVIVLCGNCFSGVFLRGSPVLLNGISLAHESADVKNSWLWQVFKNTVLRWMDDQPFQLSAALSYYSLFSLAPLLMVVIAIAGFIFGREAAQNQIVETIQGLIGQESAQAIQQIIQKAAVQPNSGILSTCLGIAVLLIGAGGVVGQLQTSLNMIWGVEPKPGQGVWSFVHQRFVSFAMVLGIGFLLLVSLAVSALLTVFSQWLGTLFGGAAFVAHVLDVLVSFIFVTALFAMIYKVLPDVRIEWKDVWIGAALTSILFTVGKFLIGIYLGTGGVTSVYGAAGSLITILLWVYYSSLIFFLGAKFTQVYASEYGSGFVPAGNAQPVGATSTTAK
jgi:membrane protein